MAEMKKQVITPPSPVGDLFKAVTWASQLELTVAPRALAGCGISYRGSGFRPSRLSTQLLFWSALPPPPILQPEVAALYSFKRVL